MLGSIADADDAVQDTALRWHGVSQSEVACPEARLARTCTRVLIDMLRRRKREGHVGSWLPEPVVVEPGPDVPMLAESLRLTFLLMLERLSPIERAAFLLRKVFDTPYEEVAGALAVSEAACRQYVLRAKRHLAQELKRFRIELHAEVELMRRFQAALEAGDMAAIVALFAPNARLVSDDCGKAIAALTSSWGATELRGSSSGWPGRCLPIWLGS